MVEKFPLKEEFDIQANFAEIKNQLKPADLEFISEAEKKLLLQIEAAQGDKESTYEACKFFLKQIDDITKQLENKLRGPNSQEWILTAILTPQALVYLLPFINKNFFIPPEKTLKLTTTLIKKITQPNVAINSYQIFTLNGLTSSLPDQLRKLNENSDQKLGGILVLQIASELKTYLPLLISKMSESTENFVSSANEWVFPAIYLISTKNPKSGIEVIDTVLQAFKVNPSLLDSPSSVILRTKLEFLRKCLILLTTQKLELKNFPTKVDIQTLVHGYTKSDSTESKTLDKDAQGAYSFSGEGLKVNLSVDQEEKISSRSLSSWATRHLNQLNKGFPGKSNAQIHFLPFGLTKLNPDNPAQAALVPRITSIAMNEFQRFMIAYHQRLNEDSSLPDCGLVYGITNPRMAQFAIESLGMKKFPPLLSKISALLSGKNIRELDQLPVVLYSSLKEMEAEFVFHLSPLVSLAGTFDETDPAKSFEELAAAKKRLVESKNQLTKKNSAPSLPNVTILESKLKKLSKAERSSIQKDIFQEQARHPNQDRLEVAYVVTAAHFTPDFQSKISLILNMLHNLEQPPKQPARK